MQPLYESITRQTETVQERRKGEFEQIISPVADGLNGACTCTPRDET